MLFIWRASETPNAAFSRGDEVFFFSSREFDAAIFMADKPALNYFIQIKNTQPKLPQLLSRFREWVETSLTNSENKRNV